MVTLVHNSMNPVSVSEDGDEEIIVVQVDIGNEKVRLINGYGPQEDNGDKEKGEAVLAFYAKLDLEVKKAKMAGALVCIEMDANSKLGPEMIPNDPKPITNNGKVLKAFVEENDLVVVNGSNLCQGVIIRYRKTVNSEEKSVIDFFVVCRKLFFQKLKNSQLMKNVIML